MILLIWQLKGNQFFMIIFNILENERGQNKAKCQHWDFMSANFLMNATGIQTHVEYMYMYMHIDSVNQVLSK